MNIFINYESPSIEFWGKLHLAVNILKKNNKKKVKIYLGHFRSFVLFTLKFALYKNKTHKKNIFFYKDIWGLTEVLIDFFKKNNFKYFALQEEEYLIFEKKKFTNFYKLLLQPKYFNKLDKFYCLSNKTKTLWENFVEKKYLKNFVVGGNPRYLFLDKILQKKKILKKKSVLIVIPAPYFDYSKTKKYLKKNQKSLEPNSNEEKAYYYFFIRKFLKEVKNYIKETFTDKY